MENKLKQGEALFAEGKIEEAEKCFLNLLEKNSEDVEALNNLGVLHCARGNVEKSESYLLKALAIKEDYSDALVNLANLYQDTKRWEEAAVQLEKCISINNQDPNLLKQLGMIYLEMGDTEKAKTVLAKSLKLNPDQEIVRQSLILLEKNDASSNDSEKEIGKGVAFFNEAYSQQNCRTKIAVLCLPGIQPFLGDIVDFLETKYDVRTCYSENNQEIESAVQWADIVWLEWANGLAIHVTNNVPQIRNKKVVCRLHGYEVFTDLPGHINWSVVDHLVFIAKHKQEIFNQKFKIQSPTQTIIRNGINTNKFTIADNKQNTKRLVFIGYLNFRKGIPLLLQFYHELLKADPDYYLYIRGEFQDPRLEMVARTMIRELSLDKKLEFVDWVEDLNSWLADKSHILSFSLEESFHYTIGNGMAAGLKPVIHAWNESRDIWPEEAIFKNLDEFLDIMLNQKYEPLTYRTFLFEHGLDLETQCLKIDNVLKALISPKNKETAIKHRASGTLSQKQTKVRQENPEATSSVQFEGRQYSRQNDLNLLLSSKETPQDYMNLLWALQNEPNYSETFLIRRFQSAFHAILGSYFNSLQIPEYDKNIILRLCQLINTDETARILGSRGNNEEFLIQAFQWLKIHLPRGEDSHSVKTANNMDTLYRLNPSSIVLGLYNTLQHGFKPLLESGYLSSFIVHGSMATMDYTLFSDVDTQLFLSDAVFSTPKVLCQVAQYIASQNIHLKLFDPIQHHGYFISTNLDCKYYPQAFLPLGTIELGLCVLGQNTLEFHPRTSTYENQFALWHMGYYFRETIVMDQYPEKPFDIKRFLSRFMMLPVLYLELFHEQYPYKRDSFEIVMQHLPEGMGMIMDQVSLIRQKWNSKLGICFNREFAMQIYNYSEYMLKQLEGLKHE